MFQRASLALLLFFVLACAAPVFAQTRPAAVNCGSVAGAYTLNSPCVHLYDINPQAGQRIVQENPACRLVNPSRVYCTQPLARNYGQTDVKNQPAPVSRNSGASEAANYPIPSTPPPAGVPAAQQATAERLWQQAAALCDQARYRQAMPYLYKGALLGDRRAEATLGIRYQDGDAVGTNDRAAAYWFGLAAAQGHRASQYALAGMYLDGEGGLPKDLAKATDLLMKSAAQGYDKAQLALGISYEFGEGVRRDRGQAIALIRKSGLADDIAAVLADPRTPKSFAGEDQFAAYLTNLRNAQLAAQWAQIRASRPGAQGGFNPAGAAEDARRRARENPPSTPVPPAIRQY
jgi:TPR repeat protein